MSLKNTSAISRGAMLAKQKQAAQTKSSGSVKIENPNRQQRRAIHKQAKKAAK